MTPTASKTITFVGAGNVATHLAKAFHKAGHRILQVWSRQYLNAQQLAHTVSAEAIENMQQLSPAAEVVILAIPDDALYHLPWQAPLQNTLLLHTSGTTPISLIAPYSTKYGVLWPLQTLSKHTETTYDTLPFCIEGSDANVTQEIQCLAATLSPHIYLLNEEKRQRLHLAAVMANNFSNALFATVQDLLQQQDIPLSSLTPIITETYKKVLQHQNSNTPPSLWQEQTGPAMRRDNETIQRHLQMLTNTPATAALYKTMTEIIQEHTQHK